jgi:hypothetical protein
VFSQWCHNELCLCIQGNSGLYVLTSETYAWSCSSQERCINIGPILEGERNTNKQTGTDIRFFCWIYSTCLQWPPWAAIHIVAHLWNYVSVIASLVSGSVTVIHNTGYRDLQTSPPRCISVWGVKDQVYQQKVETLGALLLSYFESCCPSDLM